MASPRRSKTRLWLFTALLTPFAILCLVIAWFALMGFYHAFLLQSDGATAEAIVTHLEDRGGKGSSYRANYTFRAGADEITGTSEISKDEFLELKPQAALSVRYVQSKPIINMAASRSPWSNPLYLAVAAALGIICVWALMANLHSRK